MQHLHTSNILVEGLLLWEDVWFGCCKALFVALTEPKSCVAAGCHEDDWKHPYSPPFLSCLQFLLDVLQGNVPLWGGGDAVRSIRHGGGRLQDDLEGLA